MHVSSSAASDVRTLGSTHLVVPPALSTAYVKLCQPYPRVNTSTDAKAPLIIF